MNAPSAPPDPAHPGPSTDAEDRRLRIRAGVIALVVGVALLAAKFVAWRMTDSQTVFSDAMESIVNVAAAGIALFAISFAARPADDDHPYGHGKIEFVTAGFEGGLIAFAGLTIIYEAIGALIAGHEPKRLDVGILIVAAAGVANLLLGLFLLRVGRRHGSPALQADGHHVISDFWTSAGAVGGLILVHLTGIAWIDAATAVLFALLLFWTGGKLLRQAARGLLDEMDVTLIEEVADALEIARAPGIIDVHDTRAINVGDRRHMDLHVVVPEFWSV
ncbi:MAG: cation diffusion facilitator family transporter, partial [Planctomycetes bacterium]|nr:cation diffusion facilitator family transporter [Planctomycetota bacterium]